MGLDYTDRSRITFEDGNKILKIFYNMHNLIHFTFDCNISDASSNFLNKIRGAVRLQTCCIFFIIFIALIIRMHFFIGFAGGDPQDDGIYINIAKEILQKGFYDHNFQKNMVLHNATVNPIYIFPSRLIFTYSIALSFFMFGVNDYSAALFPLICSLLSIYTVYKIGLLLWNNRVGLFASFFLSLMPIDIIYSTRITPDVPVAFFIVLSIYLFLKGARQNNALWFFAAGITVGCGYLVKETAFTAIICMGLWAIVTLIKEKKIPTKCLFVVLGVFTIILLEGAYYKVLTDFFSLRPQLISKVYKIKYAEEWKSFASHIDLKWVLIKYPIHTVFMQIKTLLNTYHHVPELSYFGLFYYPVFFSLVWLIFNKVDRAWFIIFWFIALYAFVEFGPLEVTFGLNPLVTYGLIEKQPRYLTILSAPAVILLAMWLTYWSDRYKNLVIFITIIILMLTSYRCVSSSTAYFRGYTHDLREAEQYLNNLPQKRIYADWIGIEQLFFYSRFALKFPMISIDAIAQNPDSLLLKDSYVILGGARGAGVIAEAFEKNYINVLKHIPENWITLKKISGTKDVFRSRDLTIYYIP